MQRSIRFLQTRGRTLYISLGCAVAILALGLYRLGSLTVNLGPDEIKQQLFSSSWRHISDNPLNLPYTAVQWITLHLFSHHGVTVTRLTSVLFGILGLLAFSYVVRRWYGLRTAIFAVILYATSSWVLHISRFAGPEVLYLWAVPTFLAVQILWERHANRPWIGWMAFIVIGLLLYVPGMLWLMLLSICLHPSQLIRSMQHVRVWWQWLVLVVLAGVLLMPLIAAFARNPSLVQLWLGLPAHFAAPGHIGHELLHSVSFFGYRGPSDPQRWLDRLPIFDIFTLVMFVLGVIFYVKHALAPRTRQLLGLWIIGAIFFALGGPVGFSILIPVAYLIVAAGVGYLLHEWLHVFPQNIIARSVGYGVLGLVVASAATYQIRSYFIAWPHAPATISAYHIPRE